MKHFILLFLALHCFSGSVEAQKNKTPVKPVYLSDALEPEAIAQIKNKFDRFKQQIIGHFGNKAQLENDPNLQEEKEQELIVIPIFKERTGEFWIYAELFLSSLPESPIDQRIIQFIRLNRDTILAEAYHLRNPGSYINEWEKSKPFAGLTKDQLERVSGCDAFIMELPQAHSYQTAAPEGVSCLMQAAGGAAQYMTLEYILSYEGYVLFFKFYDKNKELVRRSYEKGVFFNRLDYRKSDYVNRSPAKSKEKPEKAPKGSKKGKK